MSKKTVKLTEFVTLEAHETGIISFMIHDKNNAPRCAITDEEIRDLAKAYGYKADDDPILHRWYLENQIGRRIHDPGILT